MQLLNFVQKYGKTRQLHMKCCNVLNGRGELKSWISCKIIATSIQTLVYPAEMDKVMDLLHNQCNMEANQQFRATRTKERSSVASCILQKLTKSWISCKIIAESIQIVNSSQKHSETRQFHINSCNILNEGVGVGGRGPGGRGRGGLNQPTSHDLSKANAKHNWVGGIGREAWQFDWCWVGLGGVG